MVRSAHPFSSTNLPNTFYFVWTHPDRYNPADYFRTFSKLKTSDKERLHGHWNITLQILLQSPKQKFQDNGRRLQSSWDLPDKGLGTFWDNVEKDESASDLLDASGENIRKRSLRSAHRNIQDCTVIFIQNVVHRSIVFGTIPTTKENERKQTYCSFWHVFLLINFDC